MTHFENDMDAFIDETLRRGAALLPPPRTLRQGVARRIHYAQLRDRERRRFRSALALFAGCAAASFAAAGGAALYALSQPASGFPGLAGGAEYHLARWAAAWSDVRGEALTFAGLGLAAVALLAAGLPLGKRLLNN